MVMATYITDVEIELTDEQARNALGYWLNNQYLKEPVIVESITLDFQTGQLSLAVIPLLDLE